MRWARPQRVGAKLAERLPMGLALSAVAAVWLLGCVWSFTEQTAYAGFKGFADPTLLPLVIDGLAVSMAAVAFAASLDGRPALAARLGTAVAVLASAASNGLWAAERSSAPGVGPDLPTVVIGAGIPIAANIAFEVLLAELRRQVQRRRGLPAPVPLPTLRAARLLLAPPSTFKAWRREVLEVTAQVTAAPPALQSAGVTPGDGPHRPNGQDARDGEPPAIEGEVPVSDQVPPGVEAAADAASSAVVDAFDDTAASTGQVPGGAVPFAAVTALAVPAGPPSEGLTTVGELESPEGGRLPVSPAPVPDTDREPSADREPGTDAEPGPEANPKVWRLAEYVRESGLNPENVTGDQVAELGLCRSPRNGRRLAGRAALLCAELAGPTPPPRPDMSSVPRLLLPGEPPTLALIAREESR